MVDEPKDEEIEERIHNEIIVDAYDEEERYLSWYYYLQSQISFGCQAKCIKRIGTSPLKVGDKVLLERMAPENERDLRMLVTIQFDGDALDVPLEQLEPADDDDDDDDDTMEAIQAWHYWVNRGYRF